MNTTYVKMFEDAKINAEINRRRKERDASINKKLNLLFTAYFAIACVLSCVGMMIIGLAGFVIGALAMANGWIVGQSVEVISMFVGITGFFGLMFWVGNKVSVNDEPISP